MTSAAFDSNLAVLFSGGLDSSILVSHLIAQNHRVRPLYVDSQLVWQREELHWARRVLQAIDAPGLEPLVVIKLPLADVYGDHWSITGRGVPRADEPDEAVYLPGRNPLLMIKAQVWCRLHGVSRLALGSLQSNPFADATDEFFRQFEAAMDHAVSGHVELLRPFSALDKRQVMELGRSLPFELTFSCLAPRLGEHCGKCNKCAERQQAFLQSGLTDPTRYAASTDSIAIRGKRPCFE
ncbi:MAG: 7-cyano-7-deazaguanine synthase [Planctomycetia bacterium]|nr:7-cyano-7-deazaguanine synthase [Planctomycetia bacterium]